MRAIMEELAERRQRLGLSVAEQPARGGVRLDDDAALVGGEDAIRQRFEQSARFLALPSQVLEAALELVMHRAQRVDLVGQLGNAHVGEFRRPTGGDVSRRVGNADQGPGQRAREQPGDEPGRQQHDQSSCGDGSLDGMDLCVHDREGRGDAHHGEPRRPVPDRHVHLPFVGRGAQAFVHSHAASGVEHRAHFGSVAMILQLDERGAVELGVAADVPVRIDQGDAASEARPGQRRELGPFGRVGRRERRHETRLALQLRRDFVFEVPAQQDVGGDDRTGDRGSHEQANAREQPRGESHV